MKSDIPIEQTKRSYRMKTRAETAAATEEQILVAGLLLFRERSYDQISLEDIATQAQVTIQTVIRRFGSKEQFFGIVTRKALDQAISDRGMAQIGNITDAVEKLVAHYEQWGNLILHFLTQAEQIQTIHEITEAGRTYHHLWIERTFFPLLEILLLPLRRRRLAQLIAITDVHSWQIFRRDLGLSSDETKVAFMEILASLLQTN